MRDRISRQIQTGIGHGVPVRGHVRNRSRRREQRRGRYRTKPQAEQPRVDGRPSRKAEVGQHVCGRRQLGARRRRHTKQECSDTSQTLQLHLHAPRGVMSQCSSRVVQCGDNASHGSYIRGICVSTCVSTRHTLPGCTGNCALQHSWPTLLTLWSRCQPRLPLYQHRKLCPVPACMYQLCRRTLTLFLTLFLIQLG